MVDVLRAPPVGLVGRSAGLAPEPPPQQQQQQRRQPTRGAGSGGAAAHIGRSASARLKASARANGRPSTPVQADKADSCAANMTQRRADSSFNNSATNTFTLRPQPAPRHNDAAAAFPTGTLESTSQTKRRSSGSSNGFALRAAKSEGNLKLQSSTGAAQTGAMLSDADLFQVQLMFSACATRVVVCGCLANLYFARRGRQRDALRKADWQLASTGVPVLLLDGGQSRSRQTRRLQLILAEKGTAFALWSDTLDPQSAYTESGRSFHTLLLSDNDQYVAGLSFDNVFAAMEFYGGVRELTTAATPPADKVKRAAAADAAASTQRVRRHSFGGGSAKRLFLKKAEISHPVGFSHVTSIKAGDLAANAAVADRGALSVQRAQSCMQIANGSSTLTLASPTRSV